MSTVVHLLIGVTLVLPLLFYAHRRANAARILFALALVIAACIYVLFAVRPGGSASWVAIEALGVLAYGVLAYLGLRRSAWWLVFGWAAHPLWDVLLHDIGSGAPFTPDWYAWACVSFDLIVAGYIAHRVHARDFPQPVVA